MDSRVDGAPWQWWDNLTYGTMANAFWQDSTLTEAAYMCDALLSTPDMSEAKGLAFCDMLMSSSHLELLLL